jgi:hypothetical protein
MPQTPLHPLHGACPSSEALYVFSYLSRRGGSMRLAPMLRHLRLEPESFVAAVTDLAERYWITIHWRKPTAAPIGEDGSRAVSDIHRLCTTRFGRRKYRSSWPAY